MREQLAIKEAELSTLNENNAFSLRTFRTQVFKLQETIDAQAPLIEEGDAVKKRLEESEQRNEELMEEVKLLRKDAERASSPTADLVDAPASIGRTSLGSELFGKAQQMREKVSKFVDVL
jgi:hypothetical protein